MRKVSNSLWFLIAVLLLFGITGNFLTQAAPPKPDKNTILCDHDFDATNTWDEKKIQELFEKRGNFFKNYTDPTTGKLASWVIAERAQFYGISSRILLAKMQQESSSVWFYQDLNEPKIFRGRVIGTKVEWVLSYGLPDPPAKPQSQFKGFYNQVDNAARSLSEWFANPGLKNDKDGKPWSIREPHRVEDGTVTPTNRATIALYIYTPWIESNVKSKGSLYNVWKMMFGETGECVTAPPPSVACPLEGEPKFSLGQEVITTDELWIRESPGKNSPPVKPNPQPEGTSGKILEGPACADDYVWWKVEYQDGIIGWSAENWLAIKQYASKIAYLYEGNIWIINEDGGGKEFLLTNANSSPTWSPDGRKIAYIRWGPETEIRMANYDGSEDQKIAQVKGSLIAIRWSHDGQRIFYLGWPSDTLVNSINVSTSQEEPPIIEAEPSIGKVNYYFLGFDVARETGKIVLEETRSETFPGREENAVCFRVKKSLIVTDSNGKNKREIFSNPEFEACRKIPVAAGRTDPGMYPIFYPAISSDGRKITFINERKLWTIDVDGQNLRELTLVTMSGIAWSPDGKKIAFLRSYVTGNEIWIINSDGSGERRLVQGIQPTWALIPAP